MAKIWRILSIDGGGIRGLIPATVLAKLEQKTGKKIAEMFDFVAGTSTGAIIALGLSMPDSSNGIVSKFRAQDLVDFYLTEGPRIFDKSLLRTGSEWAFGGAQYDDKVLTEVLQNYFGQTQFESALTNVLIPSYCLEERLPTFFKSWHRKRDGQYFMYELARASSAAPTYFKPQALNTANGIMGFIDGGLTTNNPSLTALVECVRYAEPGDQYLLVSIGTGKYERSFRYQDAIHWRPIDWLNPLLDICMDGSETEVDYELLQLTRRHNIQYFRFDTALPPNGDALDDASAKNMQQLQNLANKIVDSDMADTFEQAVSALLDLQNQPKIEITWSQLPAAMQPFASKRPHKNHKNQT